MDARFFSPRPFAPGGDVQNLLKDSPAHLFGGFLALEDGAGVDVDVVVRDGIADIWGSIAELAQRDALKVLVERTPGVKQVEDHLTCELVSVS